MSGFDIETLTRFTPPQYQCENCYAIYAEFPKDAGGNSLVCKACGVEYVPSESFPLWAWETYFERMRWTVKFTDTLHHCQTLAHIAAEFRSALEHRTWETPMSCLLKALNAAQQFVHFVSYGMSLQLVGALRMTSLQVPVRGIVANAAPSIVEELKTFAEESPELKAHLYERSERPADWDLAPHQKIIVIDGLIAFKGSANLTVDGWRKAAKGLDSIEVATDVHEVMSLNNRLFSPVWARESNRTQYIMDDDIPF